jgi:hypothetical protein
LVTGAAAFQNRIALVGYDRSGNGYLELLWDFPYNQPFLGNKRHINLGSFISTGQIESVAFADSTTLYATNEKYVVANRLMEIPVGTLWGQTAHNRSPEKSFDLKVSPNPNAGKLQIQWTQPSRRRVSIKVFPIQQPKNLVFSRCEAMDAGEINLEISLGTALPAGIYILEIEGIERGLRIQQKVIYQP